MISKYIAHVIRSMNAAKVLPPEELMKISGLDPVDFDLLIAEHDGARLTLDNVDRIVEFFGMGVFSGSFIKEAFVPSSSQYKTWEGLELSEQKMINIGSVYTGTSKSPIGSLNYAKECTYFLESCDNLISIVKDSGSSDDGTDDDEEETK
jgi:hypothetical protein